MSLVVMATGGTGGHIYPAVATSKELLARGYDILLLGQKGGMEERIAAEQDLKFFGVDAGKLARSGQGMADPRELLRAARGVSQARAVLARLKPAVVVGYGGFASLPGVLAAQSLGIPTVLHEQNALLGLTQKVAVGRARAVGTAYDTVRGLPAGKGHLVGMPVREQQMSRAEALSRLGLHDGPLTILVMGGSQGSLFLNNAVPDVLTHIFGREGLLNGGLLGGGELEEQGSVNLIQPPAQPLPQIDLDFTVSALPKSPATSPATPSGTPLGRPMAERVAAPVAPLDTHRSIQVLHSTGPRWLGEVRPRLTEWPWYHASGFVDAVAAWTVADLAITRAGTSTLAEAAFHGVPLVMVPLPESAENHQYFNALAVQEAGAGRVIQQGDVAQDLGRAVLECIQPQTLQAMQDAARSRAQAGAAARFADLIEGQIRSGQQATSTESQPGQATP